MKKKLVLLGAVGALLACSFMIWFAFKDKFVPNDSHSYGVAIEIPGNIYQFSAIETKLFDIIGELRDKTEDLQLSNALYNFHSDGTGTVRFTFYFDKPSNFYSRIWEQATSNKLSGILELWVSLPDAILYHVNYNYGFIVGNTKTTDVLEIKDINIFDYYQNLIKNNDYLTNASVEPNIIQIELKKDIISAASYSADEKKLLYTFP